MAATKQPLVSEWDRFTAMLASANQADLEGFVSAVSRDMFVGVYDTLKKKTIKSVVSLRIIDSETQEECHDRLLKELHNLQLVLTEVKPKYQRPSKDNLEKLARILSGFKKGTAKTKAKIEGSKKNIRSSIDLRRETAISTMKKFYNVIMEHPWVITWNTATGAEEIDWAKFSYIGDDVPTYEQRILHFISLIREKRRTLRDSEIPRLDFDTLLVCIPKTVAGQLRWINSKTSADVTVNIVEMFRDAGFLKQITSGKDYQDGATADVKNSIYLLAAFDSESSGKYAIQIYIGKAATSVTSRWFGGESSHRQHIIDAYSPGTSKPDTYLVEAMLAYNFLLHKTWTGNAVLFVLKSGLADDELETDQNKLITMYSAQDMHFGMNKKGESKKKKSVIASPPPPSPTPSTTAK
jgi:hypothetical protein